MRNLEFSENDWHYKLIKFTWSLEPSSIKSLCPYFWLTIASIFCSPVAGVWKGIKKLVSGLKRLQERYYIKGLSKSQLYWYYITSGVPLTHETSKDRARGTDFFHFNNWNPEDFKKKTGLGKEEIMSYRGEYLKVLEKLEKKKKETTQKDYRETVENITGITKGILKIGLLAGIFCVAQLLTDLFTIAICYCIYGRDFNPNLGYTIGGIVLVSLIIYLIGLLIREYENEWKENLRSIPLFLLIPAFPVFLVYIPLRYICLGLWWLVGRLFFNTIILGVLRGFTEGFMEFGGIFAEYLNASYSDYCPMIRWKDNGKTSGDA